MYDKEKISLNQVKQWRWPDCISSHLPQKFVVCLSIEVLTWVAVMNQILIKWNSDGESSEHESDFICFHLPQQ